MPLYADTDEFITKYRRWVRDTAPDNILFEIEEASDAYLEDALDEALDEANNLIAGEIQTNWTFASIPAQSALKYGVLKHVLIGQGIWSARNAVDYTDAGGVTVQLMNKWQKYLTWLNGIEEQWSQKVSTMKRQYNMSQAWGELPSEYSTL